MKKFLLLKPVGEVFDLHAVFHPDVSDASAPQADEVCAALEGLPDVAGQGTDVRPFAADDANSGLHLLLTEVEEFYLVDDKYLGLEVHFLSSSGEVVGTVSVYLAGREGWRHLLYATYEGRSRGSSPRAEA